MRQQSHVKTIFQWCHAGSVAGTSPGGGRARNGVCNLLGRCAFKGQLRRRLEGWKARGAVGRPGHAGVTYRNPALGPIGGVVGHSSPGCGRSRMLGAAPGLAEGSFRHRRGMAPQILSGRGCPAAGTGGDRDRPGHRRGQGDRVHSWRREARVRVVAIERRIVRSHHPQSQDRQGPAAAARGGMLRERGLRRSTTAEGVAALGSRDAMNRVP